MEIQLQSQEKKINSVAQIYVHSGLQHSHKLKEWNPKMAPYIFIKNNQIPILDLIKTYKFLKLFGRILKKKASQGKNILFVGTSKTASNLVTKFAKETNIYYVNYRWLGGMITNWNTVKKRIEIFKKLNLEKNSSIYESFPKKIINKKRKTLEKLNRIFEGIQEMTKLPNLVIFTSQLKEKLAIVECHKLGISTMCISDSNCDPDFTPYFIPANDDAPGGMKIILQYLITQILSGQTKSKNSIETKVYTTFPTKSNLFKTKLFEK